MLILAIITNESSVLRTQLTRIKKWQKRDNQVAYSAERRELFNGNLFFFSTIHSLLIKKTNQGFLEFMIIRIFVHNNVSAAVNNFKLGTLGKLIKRRVNQVKI